MAAKLKKVKSILVSQPPPSNENNPYADLAKKHKLKIDFRPFIHIEGANAKEFRLQKIDLNNIQGVIFTSRVAIDHFFRICREVRFQVSSKMMYFCMSEAIAYYLQNHITYRKRKIFVGDGSVPSLTELMSKHKEACFLLPSSDILKPSIPEALKSGSFNFIRAILYKTVCSDLSDLENVSYDVLVFFSPSGIKSLLENFPGFKQNETRIAAFGTTTRKAVEDAGLFVNIKAPEKNVPSMTMAIENYIKFSNKR
tara:strand:+ start:352 stop:1113 length:762 start_codon:yes stop_codon:yes gene_type:complete